MSEKPTIRVLAGDLKGRKIVSPNDDKTHPMGAREKLALFNMVPVDGVAVLDLYAGTGALGIEALSRGAKEAVFVEKSPNVARIIRENLQSLGVEIVREGTQKPQEGFDSGSGVGARFTPKAQVFCETCQKFCENPAFLEYFDVILADPPYNRANPAELFRVADLLREGGILALSTPAKAEAWELSGIKLDKSRAYAGARISIYRKI